MTFAKLVRATKCSIIVLQFTSNMPIYFSRFRVKDYPWANKGLFNKCNDRIPMSFIKFHLMKEVAVKT